MKKIFALLILCVFLTNTTVYAESTNITPANDTNNLSEPNKMNEHNDIQDNVIVKEIDYNDKTFLSYQKRFNKYIKDAPQTVDTSDKILKEYQKYFAPAEEIKKTYDFTEKYGNSAHYKKFELKDGDFAIWDGYIRENKRIQYAAEYHKDGTLMGVVKIENVKTSVLTGVTNVFYEYRIDENSKQLKLKHIMILDDNMQFMSGENSTAAQFIYKDGQIVCYQIIQKEKFKQKPSTIFVSKDLKNLLLEEDTITLNGDLAVISMSKVLPCLIFAAPIALIGSAVYAVIATPLYTYIAGAFIGQAISDSTKKKK